MDQQSYGSSSRFAFENARQNVRFVFFGPRRGIGISSRLAQASQLSISAFVRSISAGQPSMTTPIAGPCDSPNVVMRKIWPKWLDAIPSIIQKNLYGTLPKIRWAGLVKTKRDWSAARTPASSRASQSIFAAGTDS